MNNPKQKTLWETIKKIMNQGIQAGENLMQPIANAVGSHLSTNSQRSDATHFMELALEMSKEESEELYTKTTILESRSDELTRKITALKVERNPLTKRVERDPEYANQEVEVKKPIKPEGVWNKGKALVFGPKTERIIKTVEERIEELNAEIEGAEREKAERNPRINRNHTILQFYRERNSGVFETPLVNSQVPEDIAQQAGDVNYADMRDFDGILNNT